MHIAHDAPPYGHTSRCLCKLPAKNETARNLPTLVGMVGKPNISKDAERTPGSAGSSSVSYKSPLDQERAASMADEGGTAGAHIDALEQEGRISFQPPKTPARSRHLLRQLGARLKHMLERTLKRPRRGTK